MHTKSNLWNRVYSCRWSLTPLLLIIAISSGAQPQTNTAPVAANAAPIATNAVQAMVNTGPAKPISLQECFDLALKNNLTLQIERVNPLLYEQELYSARGYYDPTIGASYTHNHNVIGGGFSQGTVLIPSTSDVDTFSGASGPFLSGNGPNGLTYRLNANTSATDGTGSSGGFDTASSSASASLTQPLLKNFLYDNGRYTIDLAKNDIKQSEQVLILQIMTILNQVEQAYYDLIYARENLRVGQMAVELATTLLDQNRKRVQIGVLAPLDEKQAQSQVAARQTDLTSALRNYNTAQNNLKKLITAKYRDLHDERLEPTIGLVALPYIVDLHESWSRAMSERPDLLQARLDLQRQGITLKYTKNQRLPELDVSGGYGYNGSGTEFGNSITDLTGTHKANWSAGASISYPLFNRAARGRYNQSKLNADKSLLTLKSKEEAALVQVDEDINQLKSAWAQVGSTKAARIYAEDALTAEQKKLEAGKSTSFVVLSLQNDLTAARYNEIAALANYNKVQSQLAFDEGHTLKRNSINVRIK